MKRGRFQREGVHLLIRDFQACRISRRVQFGVNTQPRLRGGMSDQIDDHLVTDQGPAAPILGDVTKQPMLDFVPFACPWRQMADGQSQACRICQPLQFRLPQPRAPAIAAPPPSAMIKSSWAWG